MKYAKVFGAVRWSEGVVVLGAGTTADDDHPLVKERPDLWTDEAPAPTLPGPGRAARRVEDASARPGVKRGARG